MNRYSFILGLCGAIFIFYSLYSDHLSTLWFAGAGICSVTGLILGIKSRLEENKKLKVLSVVLNLAVLIAVIGLSLLFYLVLAGELLPVVIPPLIN